VVDDRPQQVDHLARLRVEADRRGQLGKTGVGVAKGDEGAAKRGAGGGLLRPGADLLGDGDRLLRPLLRLLEAVHQHHEQRQRAEHPRPLQRRLGPHQPHRLLLLDERVRAAERAQAARELLVEQPGPLRLERLVDQRQGLAQRARAGAATGQQQLLGEERVALAAGEDVVDQPRGRVGAEQAGELLGQLGAGEAGQLQPPHAAVARQLAEQPAQRVQAVQLVAAEVSTSSTRPDRR
jgi:hypothetical protein